MLDLTPPEVLDSLWVVWLKHSQLLNEESRILEQLLNGRQRSGFSRKLLRLAGKPAATRIEAVPCRRSLSLRCPPSLWRPSSCLNGRLSGIECLIHFIHWHQGALLRKSARTCINSISLTRLHFIPSSRSQIGRRCWNLVVVPKG